ncbi:MAG: hypothetical protein WDZ54_03710 [Sneathiella sp.]
MTEQTAAAEVTLLPDRPFNPWRRSKSPKVKAIIDEAGDLLEVYELRFNKRQRKRRASDQRKFRATTEAILCDLIHHYLKGSERGIYVTRSHKVLGCAGRYCPDVLGTKLPSILDLLQTPEMAYIQQEMGHLGCTGYEGESGPARRTVIRPGPRLIRRIEEHGITLEDIETCEQKEVIVLKRAKESYWDEGGAIEYNDTSRTRRYRKDVQAINSWLSEADLDFDPAAVEGKPPLVDINDRAMRRIFSQGHFKSGGRLFGGFWQQMKKQHRIEGLLIEGEEVIELDYGQMNPRIIYGLCKAQPPQEDLYLISGYEQHRSGIKKVMNAMMFTDKPLTKMPKGVRKQFFEQQPVSDVCKAITAAHPDIKDQFYSGIGHKAQFIESEIMIDVLLKLKDKGIVALSIHDAVIVGQSKEEEVRQVMLGCFLAHTGIEGVVTTEGERPLQPIFIPSVNKGCLSPYLGRGYPLNQVFSLDLYSSLGMPL